MGSEGTGGPGDASGPGTDALEAEDASGPGDAAGARSAGEDADGGRAAPRPTRRRALGAVAAAATAGTAGCLEWILPGMRGDGSESSVGCDDVTVTGVEPVAFGNRVTANGLEAKPLGIVLQRTVHYRTEGDALDVRVAEDGRFAFLGMWVGSHPVIEKPPARNFTVEGPGRRLRGWTDRDGGDLPGERIHPDDFGDPYRPTTGWEANERSTGWVGFDVPPDLQLGCWYLRVEQTEDRLDTVVWTLPERTVRAFDGPVASPSLEAVRVPDSVGPGERVPVSVTVSNQSGVPGTYRFGLNHDAGDPVPGRLAVPAGERRTWRGELAPDGRSILGIDVRGPDRRERREVSVG